MQYCILAIHKSHTNYGRIDDVIVPTEARPVFVGTLHECSEWLKAVPETMPLWKEVGTETCGEELHYVKLANTWPHVKETWEFRAKVVCWF